MSVARAGAGLPASYNRVRLVLVLKAAAAVAIILLCVAALGFAAFPFVLPWLLVGYPIAEIAFAVWFCRRLRHINANLYSALPENHDGYIVFRRFIDSQATLSAYLDIKALFTRWFGGAPFHDIKRDNALDLIAYGFLYKRRDQLVSEGKGPLLEDMVDSLERAWSITFAPGRTPNLRLHTHLWEPLRFHYRPLLLYVIFELLTWLEHAVLLCCGFRGHNALGVKYYSYGLTPGSGGGPCSVPAARKAVVFLHGVGIGLLPYILFLLRVAACNQPVVAFEFKHLSMRLCGDIPRIEDLMSGMIAALDLHDARQVSVVGHSYGTLLASRFVQRFPNRVAGLCVIDPVCFCMFSWDLIQNFLYEPPKEASQLVTWFVSREFHTSASVSRHFFWTMLNLWPEDVPSRTLVVLSDNDQLISVASVNTMLHNNTEAIVLKHPSHAHAGFLGDAAWQDELLAKFLRMLGVVHSRSDSASSYLHLSSDYALKKA